MTTYRDLQVWKKGMDLAFEVYQLSATFPRHEQFGLTNQLRRAAISISANIAEGYCRVRKGDFLRFLSISRGSLGEVETFLQFTLRLGYISQEQFDSVWQLAQETGRLLNGLIRSLEKNEWLSSRDSRISEEVEEYGTYSRFLIPDSQT